MLFLKYLENLEQERATEAVLVGKKYAPILDKAYQRDTWSTACSFVEIELMG